MNGTQAMKRMLEAMTSTNSLGDPTLVKEDYEGDTHGEPMLCRGRRCIIIGHVGEHHARVRFDNGATETVPLEELSDIRELAYEAAPAPADEPVVEGTNMRGEDDPGYGTDANELADDLEELYEEAQELIRKLGRVVSAMPSPQSDRARSYWFAHIKAAVDADQYGYGKATDMLDSINELRGREDD